jgi:hypothetical protein
MTKWALETSPNYENKNTKDNSQSVAKLVQDKDYQAKIIGCEKNNLGNACLISPATVYHGLFGCKNFIKGGPFSDSQQLQGILQRHLRRKRVISCRIICFCNQSQGPL